MTIDRGELLIELRPKPLGPLLVARETPSGTHIKLSTEATLLPPDHAEALEAFLRDAREQRERIADAR